MSRKLPVTKPQLKRQTAQYPIEYEENDFVIEEDEVEDQQGGYQQEEEYEDEPVQEQPVAKAKRPYKYKSEESKIMKQINAENARKAKSKYVKQRKIEKLKQEIVTTKTKPVKAPPKRVIQDEEDDDPLQLEAKLERLLTKKFGHLANVNREPVVVNINQKKEKQENPQIQSMKGLILDL